METRGAPLRVHVTVVRETPPWNGRFQLSVDNAASTARLVDYLQKRLRADTVKLWVREPVRREIDANSALLGQVPNPMLFDQELTLEVETSSMAAMWDAHMESRWATAVAAWHADAPGGVPRHGAAYLTRDGEAAQAAWLEAYRRANQDGGETTVRFIQRYPQAPCRIAHGAGR